MAKRKRIDGVMAFIVSASIIHEASDASALLKVSGARRSDRRASYFAPIHIYHQSKAIKGSNSIDARCFHLRTPALEAVASQKSPVEAEVKLRLLTWFPPIRLLVCKVSRLALAVSEQDKTASEWTLDYPPGFAYFECLLSQVAKYVDPKMLDVEALGYDSWQTIYFQRATVILTEMLLVYALDRYVKTSPQSARQQCYAAALSIMLSPALLIIDHIHFQYNGFLYGILVLSIAAARTESNLLLSALLFAALLCMKHIYLYLAPAYFVYLLRVYCLSPQSMLRIHFGNAITLAFGLLFVFGTVFGPFIYWRQLDQLLARLFPFARGLCHAYWAPNFWSMYSFTDRVLLLGKGSYYDGIFAHSRKLTDIVAPRLGFAVDYSAAKSVTRGLIGDSSFSWLPNVSPRITFILTLASQVVSRFVQTAGTG
ncbi:MAG: hypothetical protein Q9173_000611 [Seirophora scorigena]